MVNHFPVERKSCRSSRAQTSSHTDSRVVFLKAHEGSAGYDVVHRADYLDIGVKVDAAVAVENHEAGVVADEGPFAHSGCLAGEGYGVDVEIAFIPASDFPIREVTFP